jgi:hypothetical protein
MAEEEEEDVGALRILDGAAILVMVEVVDVEVVEAAGMVGIKIL